MTKTKLEVLGEQIMKEIEENKKWNERAVTNEMLDHKLDVLLEALYDTRDRVVRLEERVSKLEKRLDKVEKQVQIVKDIVNSHTERFRRLEERMDKLEAQL